MHKLNYGIGMQLMFYSFEEQRYERNASYIPYFESWRKLTYKSAYLS